MLAYDGRDELESRTGSRSPWLVSQILDSKVLVACIGGTKGTGAVTPLPLALFPFQHVATLCDASSLHFKVTLRLLLLRRSIVSSSPRSHISNVYATCERFGI